MASITEQIRLVFEAVTGRATTEIAKLDRELDKAGKTTTGFQGSMNRASQFLANNWQAAAAGAATAAVAFAAKAVSSFERTALAADKFSTTTGLAVEDASRWMEVANDLGANQDAVAAAINRLNRAAASGDLAKFGVATNDVNERILQTIQRLSAMTDETQRAEAAQKLLGRGGLDALAPLVAQAGELRARLGEVSAQKVIDPAEVEKARRLRDSLDSLKDKVDDVTLEVGQALTPAVESLGGALVDVVDAADKAGVAVEDFGEKNRRAAGPVGSLIGWITGANVVTQKRKEELEKLAQQQQQNVDLDLGNERALKRYADQARDAEQATKDLADAQKEAAARAEMLARAAEEGAQREATARQKAADARAAGAELPTAQLDLRDAERALQQAIEDRDGAMRSSQSTLDGEADRLREIADAQRDVAAAQERVTEARERAVRDQRDSAREIERAEIRLADAKRELQKAGNSNTDDGFKDALDRVRLAELDLQDAREKAGERAVDDQRNIKDAQDGVADKIRKVSDLEAQLQKDRADAAEKAKRALADQAEMADRIARALLAVADAQLRVNNLQREAIGAAPITAPTSPAAARYADSLIGAGQSGPRVDPITGKIPVRAGREGGVIFNNSFTINEATDGRRVAREVDLVLGRQFVSGDYAGRRFGPQ